MPKAMNKALISHDLTGGHACLVSACPAEITLLYARHYTRFPVSPSPFFCSVFKLKSICRQHCISPIIPVYLLSFTILFARKPKNPV